jgi:hypothetical protein
VVHDGLLVRLHGERALRMASTIRRTRAVRLTSAPETSERMPPALPLPCPSPALPFPCPSLPLPLPFPFPSLPFPLLPSAPLPSTSLPSTSLCVLRVSVFESLPVLQPMIG